MRFLKDILKPNKTSIKTLPILHSCEAIDLESILSSKILKPSLCDVFKEQYLYAFYGIPSYRKKFEKATANPSYYPVCFILDYDLIPDVYKLYPCDSGAFKKLQEVQGKRIKSVIILSL